MKNLNSKIATPLIIFGAGGHAVSVANVALSMGYSIAYLIDYIKGKSNLIDFEVLEDISVLKDINSYRYAIGVGDNFIREKIYNQNSNLEFPVLAHSSAVISSFANIEKGTVIMPQAVIGPNTKVGKFCLINTHASIDHDCSMLDFSSLAPGVNTGGNVQIGKRSAISIGATIKNGVVIGDDSVIGSCSYVNKNIISNQLAYGVPAVLIRSRLPGDLYLS